MLNDYYQNIGMKGFIQRYGIVNAVKRGAFMFIKLHLVKDYEVRKVLWQEHASSKIKPYLKYRFVLWQWVALSVGNKWLLGKGVSTEFAYKVYEWQTKTSIENQYTYFDNGFTGTNFDEVR